MEQDDMQKVFAQTWVLITCLFIIFMKPELLKAFKLLRIFIRNFRIFKMLMFLKDKKLICMKGRNTRLDRVFIIEKSEGFVLFSE